MRGRGRRSVSPRRTAGAELQAGRTLPPGAVRAPHGVSRAARKVRVSDRAARTPDTVPAPGSRLLIVRPIPKTPPASPWFPPPSSKRTGRLRTIVRSVCAAVERIADAKLSSGAQSYATETIRDVAQHNYVTSRLGPERRPQLAPLQCTPDRSSAAAHRPHPPLPDVSMTMRVPRRSLQRAAPRTRDRARRRFGRRSTAPGALQVRFRIAESCTGARDEGRATAAPRSEPAVSTGPG